MSLEAFVSAATSSGVDPTVSRVFYELLISAFSVDEPEVEADLYRRYGIAGDELDDVVMKGAQLLRRVLPTPEQTQAMSPVRAVEDLLRFVQDMETCV